MNELAVRRQSSVELVPLEKRVCDALSRMTNQLDETGFGYSLPAALAPTEGQRRYLERRAADLDSYLGPADADELQAELGILLTALVSRKADEQAAGVVLKIYAMDLGDLPLFALRKACAAFRRGEIGDGKWAPGPGEIRQAALKFVAAFEWERRRIGRILSAEVRTEPVKSNKSRVDSVIASAARKSPDIQSAFGVSEGRTG